MRVCVWCREREREREREWLCGERGEQRGVRVHECITDGNTSWLNKKNQKKVELERTFTMIKGKIETTLK